MLDAMRDPWWLCLLVFAASCDQVGEFNTDSNQIYIGEVVGVNDPDNCPNGIDCSFIRRGFPAETTLEMTFDTDSLFNDPGLLTTLGEPCGPTFDLTPLLPIPPLAFDQLGLYEFPGGGRIKNYMFVARPETGALAGRDAMVFVSLIRGGTIEVRIIAGPGQEICDPTDCALLLDGQCDFYGYFDLQRENLE